ncbi:MAG: Rieske 2Fe-2S domain-containing protein [Sphingomonas sp.]
MSDWIRIAEEARIVAGEPYPAELDGAAIALYRYEGAIYAIGDNCTHEDVRLSEGWLDGDRIECRCTSRASRSAPAR